MTLAYTKSEYLGVSVAAAIGSLIFSTMPFVVGATIVTFGEPSKGGVAAAAELAAMGAGSLMIGAWLGRATCRNLALLLAAMLAVGHALSAWTIGRGDWTMFLVSRVIVGLSEGGLYGLANGTAARSDRADRAFIYIAFAQTICNALASIAIAFASLDYAPATVFTTFALFALVAVPVVMRAPPRKLLYGVSDTGFAASLLTPLTVRLLIGFAFYSIALNLLFPFVEDIGVANGISRPMIALIITCSNFAALFGPPLIAGVGLKFGRAAPIIAIAVVEVIVAFVIIRAHQPWIWGAAQLIAVALLYMLSPLMFGFAAEVDPTGRASVAASTVLTLASALGPAISGLLLEETKSYFAVGWAVAAFYLLMIATLLGTLRQKDRARAQRGSLGD